MGQNKTAEARDMRLASEACFYWHPRGAVQKFGLGFVVALSIGNAGPALFAVLSLPASAHAMRASLGAPNSGRGRQAAPAVHSRKSQTWCAMAWESPECERLVQVCVVPHCTQPWVTSSRSFDSAPLGCRAGAMD